MIMRSILLNGNVNYFIARGYGSEYPKYKNPPVGRDIVFNHLYIDWTNDSQTFLDEFLHQSTQIKNIWIPYGE